MVGVGALVKLRNLAAMGGRRFKGWAYLVGTSRSGSSGCKSVCGFYLA